MRAHYVSMAVLAAALLSVGPAWGSGAQPAVTTEKIVTDLDAEFVAFAAEIGGLQTTSTSSDCLTGMPQCSASCSGGARCSACCLLTQRAVCGCGGSSQGGGAICGCDNDQTT